jgi:dCMP deaminase
MNWDQRFLKVALLHAEFSKDESTKVGAVIVDSNRVIRSTGYNGMPRGVNDNVPERHIRPNKYMYFEHAERNALYNAARMGTAVDGCTIYVTSMPLKFPCCVDCSRAIIQSGIKRVVQEPYHGDYSRWKESCDAGNEMFHEAGIVLDIVSL